MTLPIRRGRALRLSLLLAFLLAAFPGCGAPPGPAPRTDASAAADAFVARANRELAEFETELRATLWVRATYLTQDTALLAARAIERRLALQSRLVEQARRFRGLALRPQTARALRLLELSVANPAPEDPALRAELARIGTGMEGVYGAGRYCPQGEGSCLELQELEKILAQRRDPAELLDVWRGWRRIAPPLRARYARFVELANEGARAAGFEDLGALWRARYELSPEAFEAEIERLWSDLEPLYRALHCYVRSRLAAHYGAQVVPPDGPIPAHLLGNMWAQQWGHVADLVRPYAGVADLDVDRALAAQGYDARRMTRTAAGFFVSLGLPELPETFWQRSLLEKPRDRDVVCHASAWPLDAGHDVRIKQCVERNEEHFDTLHHELGHIYYFMLYRDQPTLYRAGANSAFHEAIGDTVQLSMTPGYLRELGLIEDAEVSHEAVINRLMKLALDKVAFLPFGLLIDRWRWDVFAGRIAPDAYNASWWALRERYQGVAPPVARSEADFDPGAKYHIPANVPYIRYFFAHVLQFQFQRALCEAAGERGPLHECSIFRNRAAGEKLAQMMALGASRPWPETLESFTGTREMDASALLEYFAPLSQWLDEQNQGAQCGW